MPVRSPSRTQPTAIPIFALKWFSHPSIVPMHILAYAGGGGSAKTGIGNTVNIQYIHPPNDGQMNDGEDSTENNKTTVTIDTGVEIAVALDIMAQSSPDSSTTSFIYVAVGIGNFVKIYWIDFMNCKAREIGSLEFENSSGVNAVCWNSTGESLVVGCENGNVCIVSAQFEKHKEIPCVTLRQTMELKGHIRAICCCVYHPRNPAVLLSSAKDGTCRIWNLDIVGNNNSDDNHDDNEEKEKDPSNDDVVRDDEKCIEKLQCKIYDPNGPKPKAANILNPKPGQCLVRGCAFGDLDGRIVYTVQSGRKGGAFLSVWKLFRRAVEAEEEEPNSGGKSRFVFEFKETMRKQVSQFPVSAMSLSGDYSVLALGDTNGSITLLSTEKFQRIKFWECAHDLPVTCIAARPLPLALAGEDVLGVRVDAISASADNKLCHLTRQKKSTLKPSKRSYNGGSGKNQKTIRRLGMFYPVYLILFTIIVYTCKVSLDVCQEEYVESHDWMAVKQCVLHTVLWATSDRPGISVIPH